MTVEEYICHAVYDLNGFCILAIDKNGKKQLLLDVRGWGHICNLFPEGDQAEEFQDELGKWIADAINQKLEKQK